MSCVPTRKDRQIRERKKRKRNMTLHEHPDQVEEETLRSLYRIYQSPTLRAWAVLQWSSVVAPSVRYIIMRNIQNGRPAMKGALKWAFHACPHDDSRLDGLVKLGVLLVHMSQLRGEIEELAKHAGALLEVLKEERASLVPLAPSSQTVHVSHGTSHVRERMGYSAPPDGIVPQARDTAHRIAMIDAISEAVAHVVWSAGVSVNQEPDARRY